MVNEEEILKDNMKIIELISQGIQLEKILSTIIQCMKKQLPFSQIHVVIMRADPLKNKLIKLASSSLPNHYKKTIHQMKIGPYEGASGSAAFFKKTIIIPDIEGDTRWNKYRNIAHQFGFKASWSMPIVSSAKELLGVFSIYSNENYDPDMNTIHLVERYKQLTAIALELSNSRVNSKYKKHPFQVEKNKQEETITILAQLKRALMNEEFEVYYQPYFSLKANEVGIEALIRWNHPDKGLLPPATFLNVAESTGFIINMEKWVLNRSIYEAKKLQEKENKNLSLSVNISAKQFENRDFPNVVTDTLHMHSFSPEHLTLEITERFLVKQKNIDIMNELKQAGVRISIDDFGTSYSSLQYLKDLPIDELKIDRSFISDIDSNINNRKIVEMIIMLGHQLELTVVGEGVETKNQLQLLKQMKCDRVQGFFFSKPLPLEKFIQNYAKTVGYKR